MYPNKERSNEELQALVRALAWNDAFGCYTRAGFEKMVWPEIADRARYIIYFDLDNVHELNDLHKGYDVVDAMVNQVFSSLRLSDYVAGQFKSGDEFLVCLVESDQRPDGIDLRETIDPYVVQDRLVDALRKVGLTATFAVVPVTSPNLLANVKPAIDVVYALKKSRFGGGGR
jgi:GGDEF domain-containing protein